MRDCRRLGAAVLRGGFLHRPVDAHNGPPNGRRVAVPEDLPCFSPAENRPHLVNTLNSQFWRPAYNLLRGC